MKALSLLLFRVCFMQTPNLNDAKIVFEISHLGVLNVQGVFSEVRGELKRTETGLAIDGFIDVKSIDTGNSTRDKTILTEQYLNAESYPFIPFIAEVDTTMDLSTILIKTTIRGLGLELKSSLKMVNGELISEPIVIDRRSLGLDFGLMDSMIGNEITFVIHSGIKRRLY